ncbi:hypothetical protein [Actinoplanes sp. NPDC048796]
MSSNGQEIKNIVLVRGAFADGSGWRVAERIGAEVIATAARNAG